MGAIIWPSGVQIKLVLVSSYSVSSRRGGRPEQERILQLGDQLLHVVDPLDPGMASQLRP